MGMQVRRKLLGYEFAGVEKLICNASVLLALHPGSINYETCKVLIWHDCASLVRMLAAKERVYV